jgi:hypothetical protein
MGCTLVKIYPLIKFCDLENAFSNVLRSLIESKCPRGNGPDTGKNNYMGECLSSVLRSRISFVLRQLWKGKTKRLQN